jgi:hypothetical protein
MTIASFEIRVYHLVNKSISAKALLLQKINEQAFWFEPK